MNAEHILKKIVARSGRELGGWAGLMLAVIAAGFFPPQAGAQVEPVEPVWMVVTRTTPMRCADGPTYYKVADLKRGQVVRMDARNNRYGRVIYPAGQFALVSVENAELISDTRLRVENGSADIRSANAISGIAGSWRALYMEEIPKDAVFEIVGTVEARTGQVIGYRVLPLHPPAVPHPPYGYVELSAMREATDDEVGAHLRSVAALADEATDAGRGAVGAAELSQADAPGHPETPSLSESANKPATGHGLAGGVEAGARNVQPDAEPDTELIEQMVLPGDEEADVADQADDSSDPADPADPVDPRSGVGAAADPEPTDSADPGMSEPAADIPEEREVSSGSPPRDWLIWHELESELKRVRGGGREVLESSLDELIAEYERSLSHAETETMRNAFTVRLDWLRLRKAARDQRLALDAALRKAEELRAGATRSIQTWRSGRYDIVGKLVPSAVYDGSRLPRMYRIRAAGQTGLVRTIGYVRDVPSLDLESMIGRVVGVVGQTRVDRALHLRIITPTHIDVLGARTESATVPEG